MLLHGDSHSIELPQYYLEKDSIVLGIVGVMRAFVCLDVVQRRHVIKHLESLMRMRIGRNIPGGTMILLKGQLKQKELAQGLAGNN
jgi:hypothetical protein